MALDPTAGYRQPLDMAALVNAVAQQANAGSPAPPIDPVAGGYGAPPGAPPEYQAAPSGPQPQQPAPPGIDPQAVAQAYHNALSQLMGRGRRRPRPTGRQR